MLISQIPTKIPQAFAANGSKRTIPEASQIGITAGAASLNDGFPPLTATPIVAGGIPPNVQDFNGVLHLISANLRWYNGGGGAIYDSAFATDANVTGYPLGATLMRADGTGYWINLADGNTTNPDTGGANWAPGLNYGSTPVTMTNANVTLTALQYSKPLIVITGALATNVNLVFPPLVGTWAIKNDTTGGFSITAKTASGSGVVVPAGVVTTVYGDGTNIYMGASNGSRTASRTVVTGTGTLTPASAGGLIIVDAAGNNTQTLPPASAVALGSEYKFLVMAPGTTSITCAGADVITIGASTVAAIGLGTGDTLSLISNGVNGWDAVDGSAILSYASGFKSIQSASGYTALPNGLYVMWGTATCDASVGTAVAVNYPIAFPTQTFVVGLTARNNGATTSTAWYFSESASGFQLYGTPASVAVRYVAIGN